MRLGRSCGGCLLGEAEQFVSQNNPQDHEYVSRLPAELKRVESGVRAVPHKTFKQAPNQPRDSSTSDRCEKRAKERKSRIALRACTEEQHQQNKRYYVVCYLI